jgi:hypothetical protein
VLDAFLKSIVENKKKVELRPANFYRACIYAWNAYREDKTLTSVKYDTKKGLYAVAAQLIQAWQRRGVGFGRRPFCCSLCQSEKEGGPSMRRIISLICATILTLAGAFLVYIELAWPHSQSIPGRLIMLPVLMIGVGLLWLASDIRQWRE